MCELGTTEYAPILSHVPNCVVLSWVLYTDFNYDDSVRVNN
jgi:hypothetical protein